jgi:hypothetical protein
MATMTTAWGEPDHAVSCLLQAEIAAALGHQAEAQGVAVNHVTGVVDVVVGLPVDLRGPDRDIRTAWILDKLSDVVDRAFAADGLRLGQVHIV